MKINSKMGGVNVKLFDHQVRNKGINGVLLGSKVQVFPSLPFGVFAETFESQLAIPVATPSCVD
jgi:hypothetical protein